MRRILLLLLLLVGLVSLALAPSLFAQEVTVRYANWPTVDEEKVERMVMAEFERLNPDIKVVWEPAPWNDYTRIMITKFAAGTAPDVLNISDIPTWAGEGELMPLDSFIAEDTSLDMDDFFLNVVKAGRFDGAKTGQGPL